MHAATENAHRTVQSKQIFVDVGRWFALHKCHTCSGELDAVMNWWIVVLTKMIWDENKANWKMRWKMVKMMMVTKQKWCLAIDCQQTFGKRWKWCGTAEKGGRRTVAEGSMQPNLGKLWMGMMRDHASNHVCKLGWTATTWFLIRTQSSDSFFTFEIKNTAAESSMEPKSKLTEATHCAFLTWRCHQWHFDSGALNKNLSSDKSMPMAGSKHSDIGTCRHEACTKDWEDEMAEVGAVSAVQHSTVLYLVFLAVPHVFSMQ